HLHTSRSSDLPVPPYLLMGLPASRLRSLQGRPFTIAGPKAIRQNTTTPRARWREAWSVSQAAMTHAVIDVRLVRPAAASAGTACGGSPLRVLMLVRPRHRLALDPTRFTGLIVRLDEVRIPTHDRLLVLDFGLHPMRVAEPFVHVHPVPVPLTIP